MKDITLLILFLTEYDRECCKNQCSCAKNVASSESSNDDSNFKLFMKLFKNDDNRKIEGEKIETSPELSNEKKAEAEGLIEELVNRLKTLVS